MKYFNSVHDFVFFDLRILIPLADLRPGGTVGGRRYDLNIAVLQLRKVKHPLLNEDGIIGM